MSSSTAKITVGRWDDSTIEMELRRFLRNQHEWPSYADFVAGGRRGLRDAVTRRHGARYWARRLELQWIERPPGYPPRWTEECVNAELEAFLSGREVWPSRREFESAGLKPVRDAVTRLGGVERWAARFGLARPNHSAGSTRIWDDRRLELAIGPLVRRLERWPTKGEFRRAGLASAQAALYRHGGAERWRQRFGVVSAPSRGAVPDRRRWTDQRLEHELRAYCANRTDWPGAREFARDGKASLYKAASLYGGVRYWQQRLLLTPPQRTAREVAL